MSPAKRSASIEAEMQLADLDQDGELNRDELYRFYYGRLCTMLPLELGYSVSSMPRALLYRNALQLCKSQRQAVPQCPARHRISGVADS